MRALKGQVPSAQGNYSELREVLANIVINAYEAFTGDGLIEISTGSSPESVHMAV